MNFGCFGVYYSLIVSKAGYHQNRNPTFGRYNLQSLHLQLPPFQHFICFLKIEELFGFSQGLALNCAFRPIPIQTNIVRLQTQKPWKQPMISKGDRTLPACTKTFQCMNIIFYPILPWSSWAVTPRSASQTSSCKLCYCVTKFNQLCICYCKICCMSRETCSK